MSLYVFITRRTHPVLGEGPELPLEDWEALAASDASFREETGEERAETGQVSPRLPRYFVWMGHASESSAYFGWIDGQIEVKNPDEEMIAKMMELAGKLDAHVISEKGEIFNPDGSHKGFLS